jgi:ABC-type Na+ efflux pump permease subunit
VRLADDEKLFNALDANSQKVADLDTAPVASIEAAALTAALAAAVVVTVSSAAAEEAAEAKAAAAAEAMAVAMSNANADETFVRKRAVAPSSVTAPGTAPSPIIARKPSTDSSAAVMSAAISQVAVDAAAPAEEASTEAFTEAFTGEGAPDEATGEGPTPRMKGTQDLPGFSRWPLDCD